MKYLLLMLMASIAAMPAHTQQKRSFDPADPAAVTAELRYESAFAGFRSWRDEKPAPWKKVNEEVVGGGHAGHGKAADAKSPPEKPASTSPTKPSAHQH